MIFITYRVIQYLECSHHPRKKNPDPIAVSPYFSPMFSALGNH